MNFYGMTLVVIPDTVDVRRGWLERLFTWPWRPGLTTKTVQNPRWLPDGAMAQVDTTLYVNQRTFNSLTSALRERGKLTEATAWPRSATNYQTKAADA